MNSKLLSIVGALSITAFSAAQACEINARVSVVGNEFPAIQTVGAGAAACTCLLYTSPSPRDDATSRMPSSA